MKSDNSYPPSEKEMLLENVPLEMMIGVIAAILAAALLFNAGHIVPAALVVFTYSATSWWRYSRWQQLRTNAEELALHDILTTLRVGLSASGGLLGLSCAFSLWASDNNTIAYALAGWASIMCLTIPTLYVGYRHLVMPFLALLVVPSVLAVNLTKPQLSIELITAIVLLTALSLLISRRLEHTVSALQLANSERDKLKRELESTRNKMNKLKATTKTVEERSDSLAAKLHTNQSELKLAKGKAQALSSMLSRVTPYDSESGLLNAKKFKTVLSREWARMQRLRLPISLIYLEINDFHRFKEIYGDEAYENTLKTVSNMVAEVCRRPGDVAGRITDVNLAILLPEADEYNSENIARRLAEKIKNLDIANVGSVPNGKLTISCGVTSAVPNKRLSVEKFLGRADQSLENAKAVRGLQVCAVRYIQQTRVEVWNEAENGMFTPEIILPQLSAWGYSARARTVTPDEKYPPEIIPTDTINTVLQGRLEVMVDGVEYMLTKGDRVYLPKNAKVRVRAQDGKSVVLLAAERYGVALVA